MRERYEPGEFEGVWRSRWADADLFLTHEVEGRPKFYGLDFFPYPSGAGLSVGHCRNYVPTDVICRMKRMQGFNVLHPMGFDAFGLPAENEAIKRQRPPGEMIDDYADNYRRQMDLIGVSYDWSRSFKSSDPSYYRWTQWIFKLLHERGLAERRQAEVNWCPKDKTALANEEVVGGLCERCGTPVEKRSIPQWFFRITEYAEQLLEGLDRIDWPEGIKQMQRNWIGKSEGAQFRMDVVLPEPPSLEAAEARLAQRLPGMAEQMKQAGALLASAEATLQAANEESEDWETPLEEVRKVKAVFSLVEPQLAALAADPDPDALMNQSQSLQAIHDSLEDQLEAIREQIRGIDADDPSDKSRKQGLIRQLEQAEEIFDDIEDAFEDFLDLAVLHRANDGMELGRQDLSFEAFTTRIDTIFGVTFCVLAPEHPLVEKIISVSPLSERRRIRQYLKKAKSLTDEDRAAEGREKTGVRTLAHAINPATGQRIPLFIADYVMMGYGTGAIMAVPAHDERDFEFAFVHGLPVLPVISPEKPGKQAMPSGFTLPSSAKEGWLINSGSFTGLTIAEAQEKLIEWLEEEEFGEKKVNYRLRDWLISRQRYWGCPIPVIYDKEGHPELAPDDLLPVELPPVESYEPSDDGSSPLSRIADFVNVTTADGSLGRRETDTLGGFACSSWYFLRFCDPHNDEAAWSPESLAKWMPVDCYVGGAEHAVMHLLYARFWTKVLFDAGLCPVNEPFQTLRNQGQVLAKTPYRAPREGETLDVGDTGILVSFAEAEGMDEKDLDWRWVRMSKSKGNVVTPDEAVKAYGADALRLFELFVAPFDQNVQWTNEGMQGTSRFLTRVFKLCAELAPYWQPNWRAQIEQAEPTNRAPAIRRATHKAILKATDDIEKFAFNTYVSTLMIAVNELNELTKGNAECDDSERLAFSEAMESLILLLSPAAPHSADELWAQLDGAGFTLNCAWPVGQASLAAADVVQVAVQVNGKLRGSLEAAADASEAAVLAAAAAVEKVAPYLEGKEVVKRVYVPGRLVNFVVR